MDEARANDSVRLPLGGSGEDRRPWRAALPRLVGWSLAALAVPVIPPWARGLLVAAIVLGAAVDILRPRGAPEPKRWILLDGAGIARFDERGETVLATFAAPFGVTVLSNHARTRALLAFTTPEHTRYVRVRVAHAEEAVRARELLARASTMADTDGALGADDDAALSVASALRLLEAIERRAPGALDRLYLTDPGGTAIVLEGHELRFGERVIDLAAPLEWRGFVFHETYGPLATICQATWLRQSAIELVLVAAVPSELSSRSWKIGAPPPPAGAATRDSLVQRALVRDRRLMQSSPDVPPPREQRVAIERLFMLPLRQALDRAPPAARPNIPPPHAVPEGQA